MNNMNYTFEEAERELDNLIDKLIAEAKTDKEKYSLKQMWNTYKLYASDNTYEQGYEDGYHDIHGCYDD